MKFLNFNTLVPVMLICMTGTFFASCGGDNAPVDITGDIEVDGELI